MRAMATVSRLRLASALAPLLLALALGTTQGCGGDDDEDDGGAADSADAAPSEADAGIGADADAAAQPVECAEGDVLELLQAIPGLTVTEEPIEAPYRFFRMTYQQPADHGQPDGATFQQRITLLHRDPAAPMVLHTSGYYGYDEPFEAELTYLLEANQLNTEQRFFEPSRPDPADWSLLTIEQAAADHHRIVEALRPTVYCGKWVSTGASKGGMTSIYHRRFHPDDVDATVAYVAPISFAAGDDRYHSFFDMVADETCRQRLRDFQRELLVRRTPMLNLLNADAKKFGLTFDRLAGPEGALEDSVIEFSWGLWQYYDASYCDMVPDTTATNRELWDFFTSLGGPLVYDDAALGYYVPYYYQAETQLGYPSYPRDHIEDLLETQELPRNYMPDGVTGTYDEGAAMQDVDQWVQSEGERLLFIYGQADPWSGGAFTLGEAQDSYLYEAPGQNHGATIESLDEVDREAAFAALEQWTGVAPQASSARARRLPPEPRPLVPPPRMR